MACGIKGDNQALLGTCFDTAICYLSLWSPWYLCSSHNDSETYAAKGLSFPTVLIPQSTCPFADLIAWNIICKYTTTDLSWPDAEIQLEAHPGDTFDAADWEPVLWVITEEEDSDKALESIDDLEKAVKQHSGLKLQIPAHPPQLIDAETDMMVTVQELKSWNLMLGHNTSHSLSWYVFSFFLFSLGYITNPWMA